MKNNESKIIVAGGTGNLGGKIIKALLNRGAAVGALVRNSSNKESVAQLEQWGAQLLPVDMTNEEDVTKALQGATCVVSALQGLREVIVDVQTTLLQAAVAAGVPRFIPSDYSTDFTQLTAGENRNFDLRREFDDRLDKAAIKATSIFNGAFAEILSYGTPLLNVKKQMVGYWGDREDWKLDFTTVPNTAAFTAAAALDEKAPRYLHIAGFQISPAQMAALAGEITQTDYSLQKMGSLEELAAYNRQQRSANPEGEKEVFPRWQQSQYIHDMFTVQHESLDNDRYPGIAWTDARPFLTKMLQEDRT